MGYDKPLAIALEAAQRCFEQAMEIARKQGGRDEARAMLTEIYNWFTEGFDTADLIDAKTHRQRLSLPSSAVAHL